MSFFQTLFSHYALHSAHKALYVPLHACFVALESVHQTLSNLTNLKTLDSSSIEPSNALQTFDVQLQHHLNHQLDPQTKSLLQEHFAIIFLQSSFYDPHESTTCVNVFLDQLIAKLDTAITPLESLITPTRVSTDTKIPSNALSESTLSTLCEQHRSLTDHYVQALDTVLGSSATAPAPQSNTPGDRRKQQVHQLMHLLERCFLWHVQQQKSLPKNLYFEQSWHKNVKHTPFIWRSPLASAAFFSAPNAHVRTHLHGRFFQEYHRHWHHNHKRAVLLDILDYYEPIAAKTLKNHPYYSTDLMRFLIQGPKHHHLPAGWSAFKSLSPSDAYPNVHECLHVDHAPLAPFIQDPLGTLSIQALHITLGTQRAFETTLNAPSALSPILSAPSAPHYTYPNSSANDTLSYPLSQMQNELSAVISNVHMQTLSSALLELLEPHQLAHALCTHPFMCASLILYLLQPDSATVQHNDSSAVLTQQKLAHLLSNPQKALPQLDVLFSTIPNLINALALRTNQVELMQQSMHFLRSQKNAPLNLSTSASALLAQDSQEMAARCVLVQQAASKDSHCSDSSPTHTAPTPSEPYIPISERSTSVHPPAKIGSAPQSEALFFSAHEPLSDTHKEQLHTQLIHLSMVLHTFASSRALSWNQWNKALPLSFMAEHPSAPMSFLLPYFSQCTQTPASNTVIGTTATRAHKGDAQVYRDTHSKTTLTDPLLSLAHQRLNMLQAPQYWHHFVHLVLQSDTVAPQSFITTGTLLQGVFKTHIQKTYPNDSFAALHSRSMAPHPLVCQLEARHGQPADPFSAADCTPFSPLDHPNSAPAHTQQEHYFAYLSALSLHPLISQCADNAPMMDFFLHSVHSFSQHYPKLCAYMSYWDVPLHQHLSQVFQTPIALFQSNSLIDHSKLDPYALSALCTDLNYALQAHVNMPPDQKAPSIGTSSVNIIQDMHLQCPTASNLPRSTDATDTASQLILSYTHIWRTQLYQCLAFELLRQMDNSYSLALRSEFQNHHAHLALGLLPPQNVNVFVKANPLVPSASEKQTQTLIDAIITPKFKAPLARFLMGFDAHPLAPNIHQSPLLNTNSACTDSLKGSDRQQVHQPHSLTPNTALIDSALGGFCASLGGYAHPHILSAAQALLMEYTLRSSAPQSSQPKKRARL